MRLLVFIQGYYGGRILGHIKGHAPEGWGLHHYALPESLHPIIEAPEEVVEAFKFKREIDLVIFMGQSPSAFSLLPEVMKRVSARSVIVPIDDYSWLPLGLESQLRAELEEMGVEAVFPRTFCTLSPTGSRWIDEFAEVYGSPLLKIVEENDVVKTVRVLRGAPCGSTMYMAEKLPGTKVEIAGARAAILVQIYPCLASRRIERYFGDAPIHVAGHLVSKAVEQASRKTSAD